MRNSSRSAIQFARRMRSEMSDSERILWAQLRKRQQRFRFRRQYAVGHYFLDFYCPECRLCVEVDGDCHALRLEKDLERDAFLADQNIQTLRIPSWDVYDQLEATVDLIYRTCLDRVIGLSD